MNSEEVLEKLLDGKSFKILCGAGISLNSGMPLAKDFLKYLFQNAGIS
jgi:NAD-dependent SIR2 family protein deacetylase